MLPSHKKAIDDILKCRTPIMGGKVYHCPCCKKYEYSYHSCGNRSCPKCQNDKANIWLEKSSKLLLPVNHFTVTELCRSMITFTVPEELRTLARSNQKLFYSILFKSSSQTMEKLSLDPKYVGGKLGMIGILHTWSRTLIYHPHIHYIVTGGGYSKDNDSRSLSSVEVWNKSWVVNSIPVGKGEKALKYLAQYVFRIAISSSRIISLKNGVVTFKYKDSNTEEWKIMSLKAEEFIRRYLQHVLPSGFMKVRYYGLFASANRKLLSKVREILGCKKLESKKKAQPIKTFKCKDCKKEMIVVSIMPRYGVINNKAPPIANDILRNLNPKRSAKKIFLR